MHTHAHAHTRTCTHTVLPWVLESWAEYDIQVFGIEADILGYTNKEHALCLLNHRGDLDWMIGWVISDRLGVLGVSIQVARWCN